MATLLLGINHNTASIAIREKVAFAPELMREALKQACDSAELGELAILSTCNRTELYCVPSHLAESEGQRQDIEKAVLSWLANYHQLDSDELKNCVYTYWDEDAVRHVMKVASGLDSMVLGEPQILGQIKSAYAVAKEAGSVDSHLHRIFEDTFTVAKKVRTDTAIGENPVSVAFAAVTLAQRIFEDISKASVLMIGAGRTIELVVQHLRQANVAKIVVANRTLTHALELKEKYGVDEVLLSDIPEQLINADIVVSSTASQLPILGKGAVENALKIRKHRPIFMVDLAVPRDIEPEVGDLADIYLYSVDDLKEVIDSNVQSRQTAAAEAEHIIEKGVLDFQHKQRSLNIVSSLKAYRDKAESIRDTELKKALKSLEKGESAEDVLANMARLLTNKLIHSPSVQMKKASAEGREELVELAQVLFELNNKETNIKK
ncbi:MAG: glutamyl-tRNA reductase [SAR86 cluster bacterium]|uniref:Glutamyl-tRNA reductase n=1 Tax=SAR86 cluster bacterium TaxID=2030880 RepID=A0A2A5CFH6_9GAMM|nr:MAG: glutamyl-tRNA reductase [SAR86 cluster bacterium]